MKTNKAFSLIELMVVVAVIALLGAMLLPALDKAKRRREAQTYINTNAPAVEVPRYQYEVVGEYTADYNQIVRCVLKDGHEVLVTRTGYGLSMIHSPSCPMELDKKLKNN